MEKLTKEQIEKLTYNELIKLAKETGVKFSFQKKPDLIKEILSSITLESLESPQSSPQSLIVNPKKEVIITKNPKEISTPKTSYKIGDEKSYKDGVYIYTERGWRKKFPSNFTFEQKNN